MSSFLMNHPFKKSLGRTTKRKPSRRPSKKVFRDEVKKIVRRGREKKQWQYSVLDRGITDFNNTVPFPGRNLVDLAPSAIDSLVLGIGNSDRIGNRVKVVKANLKLMVYPSEYDADGADQNLIPQPYEVRCIIAHAKNNPTDLIVSSTFFELNNSTTSPQDNLQDMILNINKDVYVVNKDFKMKVGYRSSDGTGATPVSQNFNNNDYKMNVYKNIDITKYLPSHIVWNDTSTTPTSFMPTLIMLIAPADGSNTPTGEYPLKFYSEVTISYTDA